MSLTQPIVVTPVLDDTQQVLFVACSGSITRGTGPLRGPAAVAGGGGESPRKQLHSKRNRHHRPITAINPAGGAIYAINASDGSMLWSQPWLTPLPAPSGLADDNAGTNTSGGEGTAAAADDAGASDAGGNFAGQVGADPQPSSIPVSSELRYLWPGLLILTGSSSSYLNSNPLYVLNVSATIAAVGGGIQRNDSSSGSSSTSYGGRRSSRTERHPNRGDGRIGSGGSSAAFGVLHTTLDWLTLVAAGIRDAFDAGGHTATFGSGSSSDDAGVPVASRYHHRDHGDAEYADHERHSLRAPDPRPSPSPLPTYLPSPSLSWSCVMSSPVRHSIAVWNAWDYVLSDYHPNSVSSPPSYEPSSPAARASVSILSRARSSSAATGSATVGLSARSTAKQAPAEELSAPKTRPRRFNGYGTAFAVSDDGLVFSFNLDSVDPNQCPIAASPSASGAYPSVRCDACAEWSLQRGNRLIGTISSGPVIHVVIDADVAPAPESAVRDDAHDDGHGSSSGDVRASSSGIAQSSGAGDQPPLQSVAGSSLYASANISTHAIVSARMYIATAASGAGYSGGLYSFNLSAGGLPPLPLSVSGVHRVGDTSRAGVTSSDGSSSGNRNVPVAGGGIVPETQSTSTSNAATAAAADPSRLSSGYTPSLVRDSKRLIFSVTGASFPTAPTPFIAYGYMRSSLPPELSSSSPPLMGSSPAAPPSSTASSSVYAPGDGDGDNGGSDGAVFRGLQSNGAGSDWLLTTLTPSQLARQMQRNRPAHPGSMQPSLSPSSAAAASPLNGTPSSAEAEAETTSPPPQRLADMSSSAAPPPQRLADIPIPSLWSEWMIVGTARGEVVCLDVGPGNSGGGRNYSSSGSGGSDSGGDGDSTGDGVGSDGDGDDRTGQQANSLASLVWSHNRRLHGHSGHLSHTAAAVNASDASAALAAAAYYDADSFSGLYPQRASAPAASTSTAGREGSAGNAAGNEASSAAFGDYPVTTVWWQRLSDVNRATPVTSGSISDGFKVVVGMGNGDVLALDLLTGKPKWGSRTSGGAPIQIQRGGLFADVDGIGGLLIGIRYRLDDGWCLLCRAWAVSLLLCCRSLTTHLRPRPC